MINENDITEFVLGQFGLKIGDIVIGREIWNDLIDGKQYHKIADFLGVRGGSMENALIDPDEFLNYLFGADLEKIEKKSKNKISREYKISSCQVIPNYYESGNKGQLVKVYVNYKVAKGTKWSKGEWILFTYNPHAIKPE
jgi:hypothetical protein